MSLASDIIKAAIERGQQIADEHRESVDAAARNLTDNIGKPWMFRIGGIKEAIEAIKGGEPEPTEPPTE